MGEVKCPACRGELSTIVGRDYGDGLFDAGVECTNGDCLFEVTSVSDCAHLAYFDPRPRLPTPEEEAAHLGRHGDGAGWMVRITNPNENLIPRLKDWSPWGSPLIGQWRSSEAGWHAKIHNSGVESYPHVSGRPVRGPRGW